MGCSRQQQAGPQKRTGRLDQHISPRHRKSRAEGVSFEASRYSPSPGFSTMLSIGVNRGHGTCSTTTVPESNCEPRRSPRPLHKRIYPQDHLPASRKGSPARCPRFAECAPPSSQLRLVTTALARGGGRGTVCRVGRCAFPQPTVSPEDIDSRGP